MALDVGGFTGVMFNWLQSIWFWLLIIVAIGGAGFGGLKIRKSRKLVYPVLLHNKIGNGKEAVTNTWAGEFKNKTWLFGLIDYGSESSFRLKDGRQIFCASLDDLHEINGRMGFECYRKEDDVKIVVPISKVTFANEGLVNSIAPADYRDAASAIVKTAIEETSSSWDKIKGPLIIAGIIVAGLIVILLIVQYSNHQLDKAGEILLKVSEKVNVQPSPVSNAP